MLHAKAWRPNPGPQERFLSCSAFEALLGGAAGGGKSESLIVDPVRWIGNPKFRAIIFRRTTNELHRYLVERTPAFYRPLGGVYKISRHEWRFPSGAVIELGAMDHPQDRFKYDSVEYTRCLFDELTTFEEIQYTYMMTRMRTTDPRLPIGLRAATNPGGPGHEWVLKRFAPWLYQPGQFEDEYDGPYASPEERLAFKRGDDETTERVVPIGTPESLLRVFFPATIDDNPYISESYKAVLRGTDALTYAQKRWGDWMARPSPGLFFRRDMFNDKYLGACPTDVIYRCRHWDLAATADERNVQDVVDRGPDFTAGVRVAVRRDHSFVIEDVARARIGPDEVEGFIVATADADAREIGTGRSCLQSVEREPGASGKIAGQALMKALRGHDCILTRPTGKKIERAKPAAAQARAGNVWLVRAPWNRVFIAEAEMFPMGKKDQIDGLSGALGHCMKVGRGRARAGGRRAMPGRTGGY